MSLRVENLAYLSRGVRTYGMRPVLARARGVWELQWVFRGEAWPDRAGGGRGARRAPCLYVSHPDSSHGWAGEGRGYAEVFVVHARTVPVELEGAVNPAGTLVVELSEQEHRLQAGRLDELWELWRGGDARLGLKLEQVLVEAALLVLGRTAAAAAVISPAGRVERALHWFEENVGEGPLVEDVARAVGVSAAHLRRLFAEAGREPPRVELARLRMAVARRCLRRGWKLEQVAGYLGFSEASAFSRAFSAECGCPPREWRRRAAADAAESG